jgi:CBS domain containing-hemolysin-like protein
VRKNPLLPIRLTIAGAFAALAALPGTAHASLFEGETLDAVADGIAWVVLVVAPIVGIGVFWMVHILPEKVAEQRNHPQAKAIQVVCLLSLFFGGLFWPIAWLWAYSKPVMYKLAYGTDEVVHDHDDPPKPPDEDTQVTHPEDVKSLRARIADLEARLAKAAAQSAEGSKA